MNFEYMVILLNSADKMVNQRTFSICKYLLIPTKYPPILVSLPLKIPMLLLWNYCETIAI